MNKQYAIFNAFADPKKEEYSDYLFNFQDVLKAIQDRVPFKTNHMSEMVSVWDAIHFHHSCYTLYLVDSTGKLHEVSNDANLTDRELRPAHNIYRLWRSGAFDDCTKSFVDE